MFMEMVCEGSQGLRGIRCQVLLVVFVMSLAAPCAAQEVGGTRWTGLMHMMDLARSLRPGVFWARRSCK